MGNAPRRADRRLELVQPKAIDGTPPPNNLSAERAVLSAMLLEHNVVPIVLALLRAEDFYADAHVRIFQAIRAVWESGQPIDIVLVADYLRERDWLPAIGGPAYLSEVADGTPSIANIAAHARIVARLARRRRIISTCQQIAAEGYNEVAEDWETDVAQRVEKISQPPGDDTRSSMAEAVKASMELLERMSVAQGQILGLPTPSNELNMLLGGLQETEITLIGGKRGGGKTALLGQLAIDCARGMTLEPWIGDTCQLAAARVQGLDPRNPPDRIRVWNGALLFSQEMPTDRLMLRLQLSYGRVDGSRLRNGSMQQADWARLTAAAKVLAPLPIEIDEQPRLRIVQVRARVQRVRDEMAVRGIRLRLVGLDYLQIMDGSDLVQNEHNPTRERQLAEIGAHFVTLKKAKENRFITWALLMQVNQDGSARESKALEQAADNIIEIRIQKEANPAGVEEPPQARRAKLVVTKQRNGADFRAAETWFHEAFALYCDDESVREEVPE
jgi:replicative DNA helicase